MKKSFLYINERIDIFCPSYTEYLWSIIAIIKDDNKFISNKLLKEITLSYIKEMLEKKLIYVGNEWIDQRTIKKWELSDIEIINKIDIMWFENAEFPDFLEMVWFNFQSWYVNKLESLGMTHTTNWKTFVEENIGNLEQWINENKPKEDEK